MGYAAAVTSRQDDELGHLRGLADPEFFAYWAEVRLRYAVTSERSPEHPASKRDYDAVLAEYRRRLDGN
jgi:hypothetical protein